MKGVVLVTALGVALGGLATAQEPDVATSGADFEVASVRPSGPAANGLLGMVPIILPAGDRLTATNVPLRMLIRTAYGLQDHQIEGAPRWLASERFDVTAKAGAGTGGSIEAMQPMLRALLAERFALRAHTETRELPVYALVVARDDGQLGPGIAPSDSDCRHAEEEQRKLLDAFLKGGATALAGLLPRPGESRACAVMPSLEAARTGGLGLRADGQPMAVVAQLLEALLGRPVEDRTGLAGLYDWDLTFDIRDIAAQMAAQAGINLPVGALPESDNPSLLTALREDLGLKVDSRRGPVEVLVIDSVARPTPD
jgi:uncharacterized protein (TIGR03435 family)